MSDYLLDELRTLASKNARHSRDFIYLDDAARMLELVQDLDKCLTNGEPLPADWQH